jgi:hypothetical protein
MAPKKQNLFQRLTQLFRAGPVVKRRIKDYSGPSTSSALEIFRKQYSDVYNSTLSAYGAFDRMSRYSDFSEMEATPEIAAALDIYAEETVSVDEKGHSLHVYSENRMIHELLETLFYDTLNVEFNLVMWVRNLCKYGDFFLFNDVSPEFGIINVYPISIAEIEREEGFDPEDPAAVRFRWITQGNQTLENWQVTHFRMLGNDAFLPYGSSVLEPARRIWRQLILIEDAMLVYRVIRAPERRVFYIDVGNVPPENVADYIEQAKNSLKRSQVIDKNNGKVDLRYNPLSVDEDYFLPVRGGESGTRIETLAGGQNTAAIEDVEYIQKKLFAALKIPRAYLGYDEDVGSKATLAQEDIRFSRTIQRVQKTVISELNKMAMIHLYSHGYEGEDLIDFEIKLSNPSSIAQQQKLELISTRFDIAGKAPEGLVDRRWIQKNVMSLTDREIEKIDEGKVEDKEDDLALENVTAPAMTGGAEGEGESGGEEAGGEEAGGEEAGGDEAGGLFAGDDILGSLLTAQPGSGDMKYEIDAIEEDDFDEIEKPSIDDEDAPAKAEKQIRNIFNEPIKKSRKVTRGPAGTHMPDFKSMTGVGRTTRGQDTLNKPFDDDFIKDPFKESVGLSPPDYGGFIDDKIEQHAKMTTEIESTLKKLGSTIDISKKAVILESSKETADELLELQIDEKGNLVEDGKNS